MKLLLVLTILSSFVTAAHARAATDDDTDGIIRTIIIENRPTITTQILSSIPQKPTAIDQPTNSDIIKCWSSLNDGKQIKGECWVYVTSKYEISQDILKVLLSEKTQATGPITLELASVGPHERPQQRRILLTHRGYYDIKVTANHDLSDPKFTIFTMP